MSVKEMYVIPKEVYHTIMSELSENEKRLVDSINVDQVNLSCGPLFAGVKKGDHEEKKEKEDEEEKEEKTAEEREDDKMQSADTPIRLSSPDKRPVFSRENNAGEIVLPLTKTLKKNNSSRLVQSNNSDQLKVTPSMKRKNRWEIEGSDILRKRSPQKSQLVTASAEDMVYDNILGKYHQTSPRSDSRMKGTEFNSNNSLNIESPEKSHDQDNSTESPLNSTEYDINDTTKNAIYDQSTRLAGENNDTTIVPRRTLSPEKPTPLPGVNDLVLSSLFSSSAPYGLSGKPFQQVSQEYQSVPAIKVVESSIENLLNKSANQQEKEEISRSAKKQGKPSTAVKSLIADVEKPQSTLSSSSFYNKPSSTAGKGGKKLGPASVTTRLAKEKRNVSEIKKKRQQGIDVPLPASSRRVNYKE